jgi:hypothetical protein
VINWKEHGKDVIMRKWNVLSWHFLGGNEENHKKKNSFRIVGGLEWTGNPILVEATHPAPVQTGPGAHPTSYTTGIGCLCQA